MDKDLEILVSKILNFSPDKNDDQRNCERCGYSLGLTRFDDEPVAICDDCAQLTVIDLAEIVGKKHPAHPAIPEDVFAKLDAGITELEDLCCVDSTPEWKAGLKSARDWLAKCPQESDKATCPKCGETSEAWHTAWGLAGCRVCKHDFNVQVATVIISPPSEPEGKVKALETCVSCEKEIPEDALNGRCRINGKPAHYECVTRHVRNLVWQGKREPKVTP